MSVNIAVVGSFVTDFIFKTPRRPVRGETVIGSGFEMAMGGKGANQAVMAALLDANVWMIGRVGADNFGDMQIENMQRVNINTDCVVRDPLEGTGCSGIVLDADGDNSIVFVPRANNAVTSDDVDNARPAMEKADTLLVQLELPINVTRHAVQRGKELGLRVILDPAPACALENFFFENADIMTPNETEAAILSGVEVTDVPTAEKAARAIAEKGCATVIVTLGGEGCLLLHEDKAEHFPPVKVDVADTTAAGDAFTGSLAVWLGQGNSMRESVRLAGLVGALSTTGIGAQPSLPAREQFDAFVKELS